MADEMDPLLDDEEMFVLVDQALLDEVAESMERALLDQLGINPDATEGVN